MKKYIVTSLLLLAIVLQPNMMNANDNSTNQTYLRKQLEMSLDQKSVGVCTKGAILLSGATLTSASIALLCTPISNLVILPAAAISTAAIAAGTSLDGILKNMLTKKIIQNSKK